MTRITEDYGGHTDTEEFKSKELIPIDGLHRLTALRKAHLTEPVYVWWWFRQDKKPMTQADVTIIGMYLNKLSSASIPSSSMDITFNIYYLLSSVTEYGDSEDEARRRLINRGKAINRSRLLLFLAHKGVVHHISAKQQKKYASIVLGIWKFKSRSAELLPLLQ